MDTIFICLVLAGLSIGLIFIRELFLWLRNKIPKTVQCWFCHKKAKVEYRFSNSWFCSNCDQYNGFTKSGDYNRIIDNQYEEKLNFSISSIGRIKDCWKSTNSLCDRCNHNQELKVQQLAAFVPLNEKNFDVEIEHYREQLEKCYKLCSNCEILLSKIHNHERTLFPIPRRLITGLLIKPEVGGIGRFILYLNLFISLIVSISAYVNLEGVPPIVQTYLKCYDKYSRALYLISPTFLLPAGLSINILSWLNTHSPGLLLNSISWLIVFLLSTYSTEYKHYIISLQALSAIISCAVSIISLTSNKTQRCNKPKTNAFDGKKFNGNHFQQTTPPGLHVSNSESCSNNSGDHISQIFQKNINKKGPSSSPPKTPTSTAGIVKSPKNWTETINNGIRGLHLGNNFNNNRYFPRREGVAPLNNSSKDAAWWVNGLKNRKYPQKGNNMYTTNIFGNGNANSRPPSQSSSGYSEICEDIIDDYSPCTGHSPVCRHCLVSPTSPQYTTCYYAAAYFQRLLYTPPSPPKLSYISEDQQSQPLTPSNSSISYLYIFPVIFLIISNVALLCTFYHQQYVKT